jgi:transposase
MFQDEARFGRLPVIRTAWAPPGVRPVVRAALEREFRYVFAAVSPFEGGLDWMVTDSTKTTNMNLFLAQVRERYPHEYILMVVDGAACHTAGALKVPDNMALLRLPPYSPELNPAEGIWKHLRHEACANVLFETLDDVIDTVVRELAELARVPHRVASMFLHPWIIQAT